MALWREVKFKTIPRRLRHYCTQPNGKFKTYDKSINRTPDTRSYIRRFKPDDGKRDLTETSQQ